MNCHFYVKAKNPHIIQRKGLIIKKMSTLRPKPYALININYAMNIVNGIILFLTRKKNYLSLTSIF